MRRICGSTAMALLISLCLSSAAMAASMLLVLWRSDDFWNPSAQFQASFEVDLSSVTGVTGVTVSFGSSAYPLVSYDAGQWENNTDIPFANLDAMKTALNGTWTIDIAGTSPSISTFTLTTTGLVDGDFFATATNLSPANGATGVSADTAISWTDPTGSSTPAVLAVHVESNEGGLEQETLSILPGGISVTATMWQPPSVLSAGSNEAAVTYLDFDATLASTVAVSSGSITWSASDFAPPGYPDATPLILRGSETNVQFAVPEPSTPEAAGVAIVTILLLARFGRQRWSLA